jgi:hypothetical protein
MGIVRLLSVICVGLLAAACLPVTATAPLGSTTTMAPDPALTGMWKGHPQNETGAIYFTFLPQSDGSITAVDVMPDGKDAGWGVFSLQTATLGQYHYMNVHDVSENGKTADSDTPPKNIPALYRINGDGALVIYLLDEDRVEAAIKANKLAGTIGTGQYADVVITAPASDLDAFMATADGRALFDKPLIILKRVK